MMKVKSAPAVMLALAAALALLSAAAGPSDAGAPKKADETIFVEARKLLECRIFLPEDFDPEKSYPLVIGLHGFGGSAGGFSRIWDAFPTHSFIFAVPQAPYSAGAGASGGYSWEFRGDDRDLWRLSDPWIMQYIADVAGSVRERYRIGGTYILGFSQGAAYAYVTGIRNPDLFDGVICFGGRIPDPGRYGWLLTREQIAMGSGLRVFIAHGKDDETIGREYALDAASTLGDHGYDYELCLFDGGHSVDLPALEKAFEWLKIQKARD